MQDTSVIANVKMNHLNLDLSRFKEIQLPFAERRGGGDFRGNRSFGQGGARRDFRHNNRREFGGGAREHRGGFRGGRDRDSGGREHHQRKGRCVEVNIMHFFGLNLSIYARSAENFIFPLAS